MRPGGTHGQALKNNTETIKVAKSDQKVGMRPKEGVTTVKK